jgi:large subunit ribosomal protein L16
MLQPKRVKYRRPHSLKWEGLSKAGNTVAFGDYGLQATEGEYVSDRQIEAARVVLNNFTKRSGKVWIRIFPHMAKTKKPAEVRMGSGKGAPEFWVAVVKVNRVMFEIGGVPAKDAIEALRLASFKLPVKTKIIKREVKDVSVVNAVKPVKETKVATEGGK